MLKCDRLTALENDKYAQKSSNVRLNKEKTKIILSLKFRMAVVLA